MTARRKAGAALLALAALGPAGGASAQGIGAAPEMAALRALAIARAGATLGPFSSDGCSGGMSATWAFAAQRAPALAAAIGARPPWESCCLAHDGVYHGGGLDPEPARSYAARLVADRALEACVRAAAAPAAGDAAAAALAATMFAAVRAGGGPCTGLPWRWGYGWPDCGPGG